MKSKIFPFLLSISIVSCSFLEEKQGYIEEQTFPISIKALKVDGTPLKVKGLKFILNEVSTFCGSVPRTEFLTDENGVINSSVLIGKHYDDLHCSYDIYPEFYAEKYSPLGATSFSLPVKNIEARYAKKNYVKFLFLNDTASIERLYCATRVNYISQTSIDFYRNVSIKIEAGKPSAVILPGVRDTCFYLSCQPYDKAGKVTSNHRFYINNEVIYNKCFSGQNKDTTVYTIQIK
jgi:hypothetical protein